MSGACEWFELVQYVESFDMGINFLEGPPGPPGPPGEAIFIPSVSEDGVLSWTNTAGLPNPDPIDLSGPAGTTDYGDLTHKPSINGVELNGNKTTADLQIGIVNLPVSVRDGGTGATTAHLGLRNLGVTIPDGWTMEFIYSSGSFSLDFVVSDLERYRLTWWSEGISYQALINGEWQTIWVK